MYPTMINEAKEEDNKGALMSFKYANAVSPSHRLIIRNLDSIE